MLLSTSKNTTTDAEVNIASNEFLLKPLLGLYYFNLVRHNTILQETKICYYSPFSFFQTNSLGAEVLYDTARSYIGDTKDQLIFDLYSGTGTIAQMMAPVCKHVVGVEIVEEAVEAAKENAEQNGLSNCEFIAGDVLKALDDIREKPDYIILDPPRDGIHPKALAKLIAYGVERMVYISCKPTALARDSAVFVARGHEVR